MFSRQTTIQPKQQVAPGILGCVVATSMHSWTPSFNINLERGYDIRQRVFGTSM